MELQQKRQSEAQLLIELEQLKNHNNVLQNQAQSAKENGNKLQKLVLQMRKDKNTLEKNLQIQMDRVDLERDRVCYDSQCHAPNPWNLQICRFHKFVNFINS